MKELEDEESQQRSFQRPRELKCAKMLVESNYALGRESGKGLSYLQVPGDLELDLRKMA